MKKQISFKIEKEETLTEQQLADLLSNFFGIRCGFDQWEVEKGELYEGASEEIADERLAEESDEEICLEEVLARMLFKGGAICLLEADTEDEWHVVDLNKIISGLKLYLKNPTGDCHSVQEIVEQGDALDADAVFQYAVYGEIIYG